MDNAVLQKMASEIGALRVNNLILESQLQDLQAENDRLRAELANAGAIKGERDAANPA